MNRTTLTTLLVVMMGLLAASAYAQDTFGPGQGNGVCQFIDENGDGFNDLAPDADGDGIPNGLDEDYVRPEDGTGSMFRFGQVGDSLIKAFGESVGQMQGMGGHKYGPADGTGSGEGPADGTGFGPGAGDCTGDPLTSGSTSTHQRRGGRK